MKLDQEKSKRGDQKVEKKESKMIVEMLKFDKEEKKEEIIKKEEHPFVLKEVKTPWHKITELIRSPGGIRETASSRY